MSKAGLHSKRTSVGVSLEIIGAVVTGRQTLIPEHPNPPETMLSENKRLVLMGASLIPIRYRDKNPVEPEWQKRPRYKYEELKPRFHRRHNIGIRLGEHSKIGGNFQHCFDVDIRVAEDAGEVWAKLRELFPSHDLQSFPMVASGSGGESRHIHFVTSRPFKGKKLARSTKTFTVEKDGKPVTRYNWEIEFFGTGKQVLLPPSIHPSGGKYRWINPIEFEEDLPEIDADEIEELLTKINGHHHPMAHANGHAIDIDRPEMTIEEAEAILDVLPYDDWCHDRDGWVKVGMALHYQFEGSKEAYRLWKRFSKRSSKFELGELKYQWNRFDLNHERPVTMGTFKMIAQDIEYEAQKATKDDFEDIVETRTGDPDMGILNEVDSEAAPFPLDILHPFWRREIRLMAEDAAAPIDYVAAALLTTAASLTGNTRWAQPGPGWKEATILWSQIIGSPSASKTPALKPFINVMAQIEASWAPGFKEKYRQWQTEKRAADKKRKAWEAAFDMALEEGQEPPIMPPEAEAPPEPVPPRAFVTDVTVEALIRTHAGNPRGLLNFRDEMTGWYKNLSRYNEKSTDRPIWVEAYNGGTYTMDRVKDNQKPVKVKYFTVSILGGIQPEPLQDMLASSEDGLQARFMPFWPDEDFSPDKPVKARESHAAEALARIGELTMRVLENGSLEPVYVPFTDEAVNELYAWINDRKVRERFAPDKLKSSFGKAKGHVVRIAMVLAILDWAQDLFDDSDGPKEIGLDVLKRAIRFREDYLKPMQERVYSHGFLSAEGRLAKALAQWIVHNKAKEINARDLRRKGGVPGMSGRTDPKTVDEAFNMLEGMGWIVRKKVYREQGGRQSKDYVVNERIWDLLKEMRR